MTIYLNIMGVLAILGGILLGGVENNGLIFFLITTVIGIVAAIPYFALAYALSGLRKINEEHISELYGRIRSLNTRIDALEAMQENNKNSSLLS
ncbi:MAG: hypothetical protein FWB87_04160 [Defluviitaleaceae bacterium]|nr:hypothetical protein [Defluviitaleaceae bacterium]